MGILIERVGGVGGGGGIIRINTACCGTQPVADEVELIGAVEAGDGAVGAGDLAEEIVGPGDVAGAGEGGAGLGDVAALADGVHGVIILRYEGCASFVFLYVEDIAVWLVGVGYGVGGAGDGGEEVATVLFSRERVIGTCD